MLVSVAFDSGGTAAVRDFIKPAEPVRIEPLFQEIMGWDAALCDRAAAPTYPNLIDERHVVAELYNMTNVPMAVWIDERGNIVRPAEPAGSSDGFRSMDRSTFKMKKDATERGRAVRKAYVDAIRDWVAKGDQSEYVLSAEEVRRRINAPVNVDPLATANFRIGQYLHHQGAHRSCQALLSGDAASVPGAMELFAPDDATRRGRKRIRPGILPRDRCARRPALLSAGRAERPSRVTQIH